MTGQYQPSDTPNLTCEDGTERHPTNGWELIIIRWSHG